MFFSLRKMSTHLSLPEKGWEPRAVTVRDLRNCWLNTLVFLVARGHPCLPWAHPPCSCYQRHLLPDTWSLPPRRERWHVPLEKWPTLHLPDSHSFLTCVLGEMSARGEIILSWTQWGRARAHTNSNKTRLLTFSEHLLSTMHCAEHFACFMLLNPNNHFMRAALCSRWENWDWASHSYSPC